MALRVLLSLHPDVRAPSVRGSDRGRAFPGGGRRLRRRGWTLLRNSFERVGAGVPDGSEYVAAMLGIPNRLGADAGRELRLERTIDVGVAWLVALSRRQPLVLCIEDLQWCDPTTLDALAAADRRDRRRAGPRPPDRPQPGSSHPWPDGGPVPTLDPRATGRRRRRGRWLAPRRRTAPPGPVLERIVAAAGGIPLYVEEVGRTVLESGMLVGGEDDHWDLSSPLARPRHPRNAAGLAAGPPGRPRSGQVGGPAGRRARPHLLLRPAGHRLGHGRRLLLARFLDRVVESGSDPARPGPDGR